MANSGIAMVYKQVKPGTERNKKRKKEKKRKKKPVLSIPFHILLVINCLGQGVSPQTKPSQLITTRIPLLSLTVLGT